MKIKETSLIIRKESIFDKIRKKLLLLFCKQELQMEYKLEIFTNNRIPKPKNIIIPKEIKKKESNEK